MKKGREFRARTNKVSAVECFVRDEVRTEHRGSEVEQPGEESKGGGPQAPSFGRFKGESCQRGFGRLETCLWHVLAQIQSKHSLNQKSKSPLSDRFFGYFLSAQKVTRRRLDQKTKTTRVTRKKQNQYSRTPFRVSFPQQIVRTDIKKVSKVTYHRGLRLTLIIFISPIRMIGDIDGFCNLFLT